MVWIIEPLELLQEGQNSGFYRLTARSDEGGGGGRPYALCSHLHSTKEEARSCLEAQDKAKNFGLHIKQDSFKGKKSEADSVLPEMPKFLSAMQPNNFKQALEEAEKVQKLSELFEVIGAAIDLEKQTEVYLKSHKQFCEMSDQLYHKLYGDSPNLKALLTALDRVATARLRWEDGR